MYAESTQKGIAGDVMTGREDDYPPGMLTVGIDSPGKLEYH
jgi:hypothetical protein